MSESQDSGARPSPPPPAACNKQTAVAGDTIRKLSHDGVARTYRLHVPRSYQADRSVPLLLDLHGLTSNAQQQAALSGWNQKADQEGFVVVTPDGVGNSWNAGTCCGSAASSDVDDLGFVKAIIAELSGELCIDSRRVYASGLSNGGTMSFYLACEAADTIAAIASVSGATAVVSCKPSRAVPIVLFRATSDRIVPYDGGGIFRSAEAELELWRGVDQCTGSAVKREGVCDVYEQCAAGTEAMLCTLDAGHVAYNNQSDIDIPNVAWDFLSRHSLP